MRAAGPLTPRRLVAYALIPAALAALLLPLRPANVPAQNPAAAPENRPPAMASLIGAALDKQVKLDLNHTLDRAVRHVETETGVPLRVDPAAWDLLPWGEQTNITATVRNQTLRQALTAITRKLGLTFSVGDQGVLLQPMPALRRLPSRATVQELQALDVLSNSPMPLVPGEKDPAGAPTVQAVLTAMDVQLGPDRLDSLFAVENRLPTEIRSATVDVSRNGTLLDALEAIVRDTPATWYPWGKSIVVVPKSAHVRNQLSLKTFTARYNGADIAQVLEDLRKRSGVEFTLERGVLQRIPPDFRMVRMFWDNVPISQALESLKGFSGLDYKVTDEGITISNPANVPPPVGGGGGGGGGSGDPVIGTFTLENGMTVFIRDSQVPLELKSYLRARTQAQLDSLRELAAKAGQLPPATRPAATQPAGPSAAAPPTPALPNGGVLDVPTALPVN